MNFLFGAPSKKTDPAEEAKVWKRNLEKEMRKLDRDFASLHRAENKAVSDCKKLAKMNPASNNFNHTLQFKIKDY
jgi:hypothetical protein